MSRRKKIVLLVAAALIVVAGLIWWSSRGGTDGAEAETVTLDQYTALIDAGAVETATIDDRTNTVSGELADGGEYVVTFPREYADEVVDQLTAAGGIEVDVANSKTSFWIPLFFDLLPVLLLLAVLVLVFRVFGGRGVGSFKKAKPQTSSSEETVTFADVAGAREAVEELQEIKDFLADPTRFAAIGAKIPKGVLLYGPPGTGKTLLARAVAGEAGVPFYSLSGSDFVEMFVGVGASRVRELFQQAKKTAPAIIFVDEIDAVGRHRGAGVGGGHDEREQTLNQLLVEMDGFDVASGVILIAATNRPDILDPALLRPGRFDRQIVVDRPDLQGRKEILAVHSKNKTLSEEIDIDTVARRTPGFTGADIANLMNEAALLAARQSRTIVTAADLDMATDRVIAGPERKSRVMSERERRIVAYHEAGHALVGQVLQHTDPIHKVSIMSRGRALGWTLALPEEDRYLKSRFELKDELAMLLGGRAAEEKVFGDPTTGASDDIERVTNLARAMVTQYGMSDALGPQQFGSPKGEVFLGKDIGQSTDYSPTVAASVDSEIASIINVAHQEALAILEAERPTLDLLADALMEFETLDLPDLVKIFEGLRSDRANDMDIDLSGAP
jgi:cell division protease FtsH